MPRVIRIGVENSEGNGEFCLDLDLSSLCAGSNALRWWTRSQSIRTEGEVPFEAALINLSEPPVYQQIAEKALLLNQLRMNPNRIAVCLGVDRRSVVQALRWLKSKQMLDAGET